MAARTLSYEGFVNSAQYLISQFGSDSLGKSMRITVRVIPNAKTFGIEKREGMFVVRVNEQPEKGKATEALLKGLSKVLEHKVVLVRGNTSRNKVIEIEGEESSILRKLEQACS